MDWLAVFIGGLLGSAHCVGMCGGFAVTIGATSPPRGVLYRQLIFSAGRILTYAFLGAAGGAAGGYLTRYQLPLVGVQQVLSIFGGVLMIIVGLSVLNLWPRRGKRANSACSLTAPIVGDFMGIGGAVGALVAGVATGFLPCGLVYGFLAKAAAGGSAVEGTATMACFGLGTVPLMVVVGCGGAVMSHVTRMRVLRVAAVVVIVMGGLTIRRGFPLGGQSCCHDGLRVQAL